MIAFFLDFLFIFVSFLFGQWVGKFFRGDK
jgi:hypothetical protein